VVEQFSGVIALGLPATLSLARRAGTYNFDGFVKSRHWCHCERSEAISLAVTA